MAEKRYKTPDNTDPAQAVKRAYEEYGRNFRIHNANSQVPTGYGYVNLTTNSEGSVTTAQFYRGVASQITEINFVNDVAGSYNNTYFKIFSANYEREYWVWYNVSGAGTAPVPADPTVILKEVPIQTNDLGVLVALATKTILEGTRDFGPFTLNKTQLLISTMEAGATFDSVDVSTGLDISTRQAGTSIFLKTIHLPYNGSTKYVFNKAEGLFEIVPNIEGRVTINGLESGQIDSLELSTAGWTELVVTFPEGADTVSINIQNTDPVNRAMVRFDSEDTFGMLIAANLGERQYVVKKTLSFFFKAESGTPTLYIEVLS